MLLASIFSMVMASWLLAPLPPHVAQSPAQAAPGLVTASWLADHLNDSDLVLLHVGNARDYATHIPGARLMTLADVSVSDPSATGLNLQMLPPDQLRQKLESFGISTNSRIVVYPAINSVQSATRVVLTLDYAGLGARTSLLDGGLTGWVAAGRPTTDTVPPAATPGSLKALAVQPIIVDGAFVLEHLKKPGFVIVDARAKALYDGVQTGGSAERPHKTGHIDGAVSVPFSEITNGASQFKSVAELKAVFDAAGVKPGDTVVAYCHIGQQATATIFGARLLGHPVLLYDGSFEEWSRLPNAPVRNLSIKK
jgi:thiosulfate/3-mercaptopyruvate sulfurtransferase